MALKKSREESVIEWFSQTDYDYETAKAMFRTKRYMYVIFMCHLSVEKALKALYIEKTGEEPPKTHNLNYLIKLVNLSPGEEDSGFIDKLTDLCIPTRYPEDLALLRQYYSRKDIKEVLTKSKKVITWSKQQSKIL